MLKWSKHPHHHVRRFSSEGCRPRLPWAMAIPHKAGGRVELGGSLRGYWIIDTNNHLIIRFNHTTEEYILHKVKVASTNAETILLLGTDNNGIVAYAKKY